MMVSAQVVNPRDIDKQNIIRTGSQATVSNSGIVHGFALLLRVISGVLAIMCLYRLIRGVWGYWLASGINTLVEAAEQDLLHSLYFLIGFLFTYLISGFLLKL